MLTAKEVSALLAQRAEDIAKYLLPNGKREGDEYRAGNVSGDAGKSLSVCIRGDKMGVFCDFATGESGDLLDLWRLNRSVTLSKATKEACAYLGVAQDKLLNYNPSRRFKRPQAILTLARDSSPVTQYLINERKLKSETVTAYKISEKNNQIVFPYYRDNELLFVKYLSLNRVDGKKQITAEKDCEPCLFGWPLIPSDTRTVTICEGEIDAMTLLQYGLPALSVPFGGGVGKKHHWLEYEFDRLAVFDDIYLCFDQDKEGQAAVSDLVERLGRHRCRIVTLPHKDANACLQAGVSQQDIQRCFDHARTCDPDELKPATAFVEQVIAEFHPPENAERNHAI